MRPCQNKTEKPVKSAGWADWQKANSEALASSNRWVEQNGLPLARFRQF
ncbi:type II toxin-antitoxin system CcdA family antitoxin [Novosphingobium sp. ERN07]|nr:type II toxin-antitoxin system CcdA family antitoxin [Novosphingobium sp. ERN07]NLR71897.1 type II toxin-antitoxin system CcdA family antitoxin [Novosphingobium sp. ERN07]